MNLMRKYIYLTSIFFSIAFGCATHQQQKNSIPQVEPYDPTKCIPYEALVESKHPETEFFLSREKILLHAHNGFQKTIEHSSSKTSEIIDMYAQQQVPTSLTGVPTNQFPTTKFRLFFENDCRLEAEVRTPDGTLKKTHLVWKKDLPFTQAEKEAAPGTDLFIGPPSHPQPGATDPMTGIYERKMISHP